MQDLNDLYLFVQAVDHGGFAAAARALGLQKSKVSRRIGLLEERLGVRLIQRSTRRFSVTEIGQEYYRRCVAMLIEAEGAQTVIDQSRAEPCGVVRLSCPTGLLAFQFGGLFGRFMALYPAVELHIESTNRRVDVIGEGFDLAIRVRPPPLTESELVMRRFDERTIRIVASPDLLKQRAITLPADLTGLPSVDFGPAGGEHRWRLTHADGSVAEVRHTPRLITDDMAVLRDAALAGAGAGRLGRSASRTAGDVAARLETLERNRPCGLSIAARTASLGPGAARLPRRRMCGTAAAGSRIRSRLKLLAPAALHRKMSLPLDGREEF